MHVASDVRFFNSLDEIAEFADRLERLNLASRRPSPFATISYMRAFLANDEFAVGDYTPLFLVAFDGSEPVGWLALRRERVRILGVPTTRIAFLVSHDNERPGIVCREENERRCADAFVTALLERDRDWSQIEWMEQDATSTLATAAEQARGFLVRRFGNNPNATMVCQWEHAGEYFQGLSKNFRNALRHGIRRLLAEGQVEFVSSWDAEANRRLLELHLEIETNSWKGPQAAGIGRHPRRIAFFRALLDPGQPMAMSFRTLLLNGVPIASELNGVFAGSWFSLEGTYDEVYRDCSPGHLVFLMSVREALEQRAKAVNLLNNFAYSKKRFNAVITDTAAVEIFRPGTLSWAKAHGGAWRRRLLGKPTTQADVDFNLDKPKPDGGAAELPGTARPDRSASRTRAAALLAACEGRLMREDATALVELSGLDAARPRQGAPTPVRSTPQPGSA